MKECTENEQLVPQVVPQVPYSAVPTRRGPSSPKRSRILPIPLTLFATLAWRRLVVRVDVFPSKAIESIRQRADLRPQRIRIYGLLYVIDGAEGISLTSSGGVVAMSGKKHDRNPSAGPGRSHALEQLESVELGHGHIGDHQPHVIAQRLAQTFLGIVRHDEWTPERSQQRLHGYQVRPIIVDYNDAPPAISHGQPRQIVLTDYAGTSVPPLADFLGNARLVWRRPVAQQNAGQSRWASGGSDGPDPWTP